jgi:hypothetical protein
MNYAEIKILNTTEYREELLNSFDYYPGIDLKKSHILNSNAQYVVTDELRQVSKLALV